jgi:hypothetical protein
VVFPGENVTGKSPGFYLDLPDFPDQLGRFHISGRQQVRRKDKFPIRALQPRLTPH